MADLKKSSLITFMTQAGIFTFAFFTSILLARILGPANRGIYALIILVPSVLVRIGTCGQEIANVYYTANKKFKIDDIISNSFWVSFALGIIVVVLFWAASITGFVQDFLRVRNVPILLLWLAVLTVGPNLLSSFFNRILLGREEMLKFNVANCSHFVFQLLLVIILLIVYSRGLFGAVLAYTAAITGAALISYIFVIKLGSVSFSFNKTLLKQSLFYGGKGHLGNIAQFMNYRLDMFLVAFFLNVAAVGHYAIAVALAEKLWMIPGVMGVVLFPRISSVDKEEANRLTPKITRITFLVVIVLALFLFILAKPLIALLFGEAYLPSVLPLFLLLPGVVFLTLTKILTSDLAGRGKTEYVAYCALTSLAVNIPLNFLLIPMYGIAGAAIASTIAYTLSTIVAVVGFTRISSVSYRDLLIIKRSDLTVFRKMFSS